MFRQMRRKDKAFTEEETIRIIEEGVKKLWCGIVAVNGDDGYPYTIPVTYAYRNNKIYFHSAKAGHKIDSIIRNPKVSFCVVAKNGKGEENFISNPSDSTVPLEKQNYTHVYQSAVIFGRARIITDDTESMAALELLIRQRTPENLERGLLEIKNRASALTMVEIEIEHMSGKGVSDKTLVV